MNINGMIVAELKRRRADAVARLEAADKALALFTGEEVKAPGKGRKVKKVRSEAQKEAIKKAQEARKAKAVARGPQAVAGKGAPLAAAAGE